MLNSFMQTYFCEVLQNPNCTVLDMDDDVHQSDAFLFNRWAGKGKRATVEFISNGINVKRKKK